MINFILNDEDVSTDEPQGSTVLDFVRYHKDLKGTKIGCREGDCGACTILVGDLIGDKVKYRSMTSCLMPLANAHGKHIVTVEGINPADGSLTTVQKEMVDKSGTQCGFCTVGFVMSLTGFCLDAAGAEAGRPRVKNCEIANSEPLAAAISAIDGNICRCTGYKSIERAAEEICTHLAAGDKQFAPAYFDGISARLGALRPAGRQPQIDDYQFVVSGGTDLYVQRPEAMEASRSIPVMYDERLHGIRDTGEAIEIGASTTVTDLLESSVMNSIFPDLYDHLKLVSSTPIRNMATLAGNFVNASPIGDMTVWFLALDAEIELSSGRSAANDDGVHSRWIGLREFYLGYKQLAKKSDEIISKIRFSKPTDGFRFNFEKVCKRTYLDIASVNSAISLTMQGGVVRQAHIAAGGVAPIPLYLRATSGFLIGKAINPETIGQANEMMQAEISPISDVRGTESYKRLLLRQLFRAHFYEIFGDDAL